MCYVKNPLQLQRAEQHVHVLGNHEDSLGDTVPYSGKYDAVCIHGIELHSLKYLKSIRKTCPCNIHVYPLKPHFYIAKLWYAGVYLFFLFLLQNIGCGYSSEPPRRGGSNVYPQSMF